MFTYGPSQEFRTEPIKISATVEPTMSTVTVQGNIELTEEGVLEVGIRVSGILYDTKIKITPNSSGKFSLKFEGLEYETAYDYYYYIYQNREYTYHKLGSFKTTFVTMSAVEVGFTGVRFEGNCDFRRDNATVRWGVFYSANETLLKTLEPDHGSLPTEVLTFVTYENAVYCDQLIFNLDYNRTYYYCPFLFDVGKHILGDINTFTTSHIDVTVSAESITQTTATFTGKVDPLKINNIEVGVLYSTSSSNPTFAASGVNKVVLNDLVGSDGNFTYKAEKLLNGSTYYYRSYSLYNDFIHYGEVGSFKTESVPDVTMTIDNIDKNAVTLKGNVQFSEAGVIELGVQYYPASRPDEIYMSRITEISEGGDFTNEISGLKATKYYYQYYLLQDGIKLVGPLQTFEMSDPYNVQSNLNAAAATNLSSSSSANCYIISQSGLYKFLPVKGNSSVSVGNVTSAFILWESFATGITGHLQTSVA